jgi:hypothetical protein
MLLRVSQGVAVLLATSVAVLATVPIAGCSGDGGDGGDSAGADISSGPAGEDLPWEVTSDQGESVLPNLFYAEASENEQVMPLTVHGRSQIDRLVYPTIGNPNLYTKSDAKDSLMAVLRIEESAYAHLKPNATQNIAGTTMSVLQLTEDDKNSLSFYLVDHGARPANTESNQAIAKADGQHVIRIKPSQIRLQSVPSDMPAAFKARRTLRVIFDQAAMASVPQGLYDLRYEVKQNGAIATGKSGPLAEFQYNAVRVFDKPADEYSVVNVTDTQVSNGLTFKGRTLTRLQEFVQRINATTDPAVRSAAFITFNGDLHNGGSPETVLADGVATTYNLEATAILDTIKDLNLPIFLTVGNHDGYVATGVLPFALDPLGTALKSAVTKAGGSAWPNFSFDQYQAYLDKNANTPGGFHNDIFNGQFIRRDGKTFGEAWKPIAQSSRNMVLYDGQHQWHRTYGPSYASFSFGKNHYMNLNSFDLRQHRRTGWGMYTVNYGGGMSHVQEAWLERQVGRVEQNAAAPQDIVFIAHHDPRGGHHGLDFPYLFPQVDYTGLPEVIRNFVIGEVINPKLCAVVPTFAQSDDFQVSCIHDGLQEWMLADPEFDCADGDKKPDGHCNLDAIKADSKKSLYFSNLSLVQLVATHPSIRTLLLGHTHYNYLEVLQSGDAIIPGDDSLDKDKIAGLNVDNPVRAFSFFAKLTGRKDFDPAAMNNPEPVWSDSDDGVQLHRKAIPMIQRAVQGSGRELVVLRLTSNADITSQQFCATPDNCKTMLGFSTFQVSKKTFSLPQINDVTFFLNDGGGTFETVKSITLPRSARVSRDSENNPVNPLFKLKK